MLHGGLPECSGPQQKVILEHQTESHWSHYTILVWLDPSFADPLPDSVLQSTCQALICTCHAQTRSYPSISELFLLTHHPTPEINYTLSLTNINVLNLCIACILKLCKCNYNIAYPWHTWTSKIEFKSSCAYWYLTQCLYVQEYGQWTTTHHFPHVGSSLSPPQLIMSLYNQSLFFFTDTCR